VVQAQPTQTFQTIGSLVLAFTQNTRRRVVSPVGSRCNQLKPSKLLGCWSLLSHKTHRQVVSPVGSRCNQLEPSKLLGCRFSLYTFTKNTSSGGHAVIPFQTSSFQVHVSLLSSFNYTPPKHSFITFLSLNPKSLELLTYTSPLLI